MNKKLLIGNNKKHFLNFFLISTALLFPYKLIADTNISNGNLFKCRDSELISTKTGLSISSAKAKNRYRKIIENKNAIISTAPDGSPQEQRAIAAKKIARRGIRDINDCAQGTFDRTADFLGDWGLATENGSTPAELGYNYMTLSFLENTFINVYDSASLHCRWEGSYSILRDYTAIEITVTSATGGALCEQSIGQTRKAAVVFNSDKSLLTVDYRPNGSLQEYFKAI